MNQDQLILKLREEVSSLEKKLDEMKDKEHIKHAYESVMRKKVVQITSSVKDWKNIVSDYIADGSEINPENINPKLYILKKGETSIYSKLFRVAQLTWSIPLSNGFGRRIRGLVLDDCNNKLIGIFGLCDPIYNRDSRDKYIGWNQEIKKQKLVNLMSSYILGSVAPYNDLLFGKFIASIVGSKEIVNEFEKRYFNSEGTISKKNKRAQLVGIVNTTAFGKSTMMNRLKNWEFIGDTKGVGTSFQSDGIFEIAKNLVKMTKPDEYMSYDYGNGANWKLRILREAYRIANIDQKVIEKGNKKGIYFLKIAKNWRDVLLSKEFVRADYSEIKSVEEIWQTHKQKVIKRSYRIDRWKSFEKVSIINRIEMIKEGK